MEVAVSLLIGYSLGSFPTAYIFIKKTLGIDITKNGSGSVGAHNSWDISKSKTTGLIVLLIDLLKGFCAVLLSKYFFSNSFLNEILALNGAVLSHCYSPWIKFKGGRGLATAAGGALIISFWIVLMWCTVWLLVFLIKRNLYWSNIAATFLSSGLSFIFSKVLINYTNPLPNSELQFSLFVSLMFLIILSRHIEPIKEYLLNHQKNLRN
jgi:acyl phosphate:glycerol-3-phosphate acyltransferase